MILLWLYKPWKYYYTIHLSNFKRDESNCFILLSKTLTESRGNVESKTEKKILRKEDEMKWRYVRGRNP